MPSTRTWLQVGGGAVLAALVVTAVFQAASSSASWVSNEPVGQCGKTSGGEVVAAQNVLSAGTALQPVDGTWNSETDAATRAFQAYNGLPVDGCVNTSTWVTMRALAVSVCDPEFDCHGPDHRVRFATDDGLREAYLAQNDCDWGSFVQPGVARSPVTSDTIIAMSRDTVTAIECES